MQKKNQPKKVVTNVPKKLAGSKAKDKKVRLVNYSVMAIIPTGMYSNIQPCVVVEAETLEQAERAVMPHIESLFAKYRSDSSIMPQVRVVAQPVVPVKPVVPEAQKPVSQVTPPAGPTPAQVEAQAKAPEAPVKPVETAQAPIQLSVPFQRAKSAIESCNSKEALNLVKAQVEKSVKLTEDEKKELLSLVVGKARTLNRA